MTSATSRLSRVFLAAAVLASGASVPALAGGPAFLKLGGVEGESQDDKHKNQIEILSYSWGATRAGGKMHLEDVSVAPSAGAKGGNVEFEWKVEEGESAPPAPGGSAKFGAVSGMHRDSGMRESGEKGGTEDINIGVGELQESGQARKRQHGWVPVSKPLDRGAVRVKVKMPWAGCTVGARYPSLQLGGDGNSYTLHDVTVASCSASGDADDRPTEEVAFYYNRIAFNYAATRDAP